MNLLACALFAALTFCKVNFSYGENGAVPIDQNGSGYRSPRIAISIQLDINGKHQGSNLNGGGSSHSNYVQPPEILLEPTENELPQNTMSKPGNKTKMFKWISLPALPGLNLLPSLLPSISALIPGLPGLPSLPSISNLIPIKPPSTSGWGSWPSWLPRLWKSNNGKAPTQTNTNANVAAAPAARNSVEDGNMAKRMR